MCNILNNFPYRSRLAAIELTCADSDPELVRDPFTSAFYPLSQDAIQAIDAIECIADYIKKSEEQKMVWNRSFNKLFLSRSGF